MVMKVKGYLFKEVIVIDGILLRISVIRQLMFLKWGFLIFYNNISNA